MKNAFTTAFPAYACDGDEIIASVDGFDITARIVRDDTPDAPDERDESFWPSRDKNAAGYVVPHNYNEQMKHAEEIMKAWRNDEWFYCGIVLSVSKPVNVPGRVQFEVVISDHAASLWGIECNYPGSKNEYLTQVANGLIEEALNFAKTLLSQIKE